MEQSPDAFSEAELYAMLDAQPAIQSEQELRGVAHKQAHSTIWSTIDTIDDIALAVGRDGESCTIAILNLRRHYLASIHEIEGTPDDQATLEAQSDTALNMAAVRCGEDMDIVEALINLRAECYLGEMNAQEISEMKQRLIAERYASRDDAQQLVQSLIADPDYIPTPDTDADQWIEIIDQAFDGAPFDCHDPNNLALILDALYEPAESEDSQRMRLFNELIDHFEDSTDSFTKVYGLLSATMAQMLADQLLQIACTYDADTNLAQQDEHIDSILRSLPDLSLTSSDIKAIITPYRGQLSDDHK